MIFSNRTVAGAAICAVTLVAVGTAQAADVVTQVINLGSPTLPFSTFYGHTFATPLPISSTDRFYDDYAFTVSNASFSSVSATFNLGDLLNVANLSARLFAGTPWAGSTPGTLSAIDLQSRWSSTVASGTGTGTYQVVSPTTLALGQYVLEVRGNVTGTFGGSYGGVLNLTPVPESSGALMALAGFGFLGAARLRRKSAA